MRRAREILPRFARSYEIVLVDDGSRDRTGEIADHLAAADSRIRVIHHPVNRGYGAALRSGFAACSHERIFYTDGDNQFDLAEIALLLPLSRDHEIVTGYRFARRDPIHRKVNAWIFNAAMRVLFGLRLRDADCAFKLYWGSVFRGISLVSEGAMIDVEILARARLRGARIAEVGVHHYPRTAGRSSGGDPRVILRAVRELIRLRRELR